MPKTRRNTLRLHPSRHRKHPMHGSHKVGFLIIGGGAFLTFLLILLQGLLSQAEAQTFQGPGTSAGTGQGAIGVNTAKNLSVGTSTPLADTKLLIVASSTASSGFPLKVLRPDSTVLFVIGNDGRLGAGGAASSTYIFTVNGDMLVTGALQSTNGYVGTLNANNISAGTFGANTGGGNYNFPANLSIGTSTVPTGGVLFVNGNVGIGTSAPGTNLDVYSAAGAAVIRSNAFYARDTNSNGGNGICIGTSLSANGTCYTSEQWLILRATGTSTAADARYDFNSAYNGVVDRMLPITFSMQGSEIMRVATSSVRVTGDLYANAFYYNSDERLKTNIRPARGLDAILKLNGVAFDWKKDGRRDVGLVAQDVEKVFPELVATDAATGLKSVKYGNLIAPLIQAVKELNGKLETQAAKIEELEHELEILRSR